MSVHEAGELIGIADFPFVAWNRSRIQQADEWTNRKARRQLVIIVPPACYDAIHPGGMPSEHSPRFH